MGVRECCRWLVRKGPRPPLSNRCRCQCGDTSPRRRAARPSHPRSRRQSGNHRTRRLCRDRPAPCGSCQTRAAGRPFSAPLESPGDPLNRPRQAPHLRLELKRCSPPPSPIPAHSEGRRGHLAAGIRNREFGNFRCALPGFPSRRGPSAPHRTRSCHRVAPRHAPRSPPVRARPRGRGRAPSGN